MSTSTPSISRRRSSAGSNTTSSAASPSFSRPIWRAASRASSSSPTPGRFSRARDPLTVVTRKPGWATGLLTPASPPDQGPNGPRQSATTVEEHHDHCRRDRTDTRRGPSTRPSRRRRYGAGLDRRLDGQPQAHPRRRVVRRVRYAEKVPRTDRARQVDASRARCQRGRHLRPARRRSRLGRTRRPLNHTVLELDGRFAVVTGGASGIGAAVSERLQHEGVRVASLDVQPGGPAELQIECDVTDEASILAGFATVHDRFGALHYGFVNAGIAGVGSFLNMPAEEWHRVMRVNLRGAFLTMQCAGRAIRDSHAGGAIVATASSAGVLADLGMVHYSVAKMGIRQMVRVAARELGRYGIRVNAVAPGVTNTPMTE